MQITPISSFVLPKKQTFTSNKPVFEDIDVKDSNDYYTKKQIGGAVLATALYNANPAANNPIIAPIIKR